MAKTTPPPQAVYHKDAQNLYLLESSGTYYVLFKRAGKQIRHFLKSTDPTLARLNRVNVAGKITLADLARRWLDSPSI